MIKILLFGLLLLSCYSLWADDNSDQPASLQPPPLAVWIDTDPAVGIKNRDVDDGLALLQAFHSPELKIQGISVVSGNVPLKKGYPIAQKMVKRFAPAEIPVYRGAAGKDELGKETPASQALAKALEKQKLTLLVLGPATNVATVIQNHPQLAYSQIQEIVAVAGRRPGQRFTTGRVNPKAHRDLNFELDPEAFAIILQSDIPLTLTPFEISSKVWLTQEDLNRLAKANQAGKWIAPFAKDWLQFWKEVFAVDGFNPFDTLAVGYLTHPHLYQCSKLPIEIHVLPDDRTEQRMQGGQKNQKKPYLLVSPNWDTQRQARYCFEAKPGFKEMLLQRLAK